MKNIDILTLGQIVDAQLITVGDAKELLKRPIGHVTQDSRNLQHNSLYAAIVGERLDGHQFIQECFEKGAVACLSEQEILPDGEGVLLLVKNVREALLKMAAHYRSQFDIPFVGITGSVGKTTTKDMVTSVISQKYNALCTQGNYNNDIGVPLTLFNLTDEHEIAVIEMGMNHFGEIHVLTEVVRPQVGLISNIGVAHIEYLGSREGILEAKMEMFDSMDEHGIAVFNADNDMLWSMAGKMPQKQVWFGVENKAGIYADEIEIVGLEKTKCVIHTDKGNVEVLIPMPGEHMVLNALSAVAVGLTFGLTLQQIKVGIESFLPTKNRLNMIQEDGLTIIDDVYNANPVSMKASLDILATSKGRKVAILGFMGELGAFAETMHTEVGEYAGMKGIDVLYYIGKHAESMAKGARNKGIKEIYCFDTQEELWEDERFSLEKDDVVLVKGSRSMALEKTVDKIRGVKR